MSYQVLARKWRPRTFDEVHGQEHVTVPLQNAIRTGRVPHAVLLTGPRGVGKTTVARILARCLNCEKGPTDTPCGTCGPCREIAAGSSTDVQEIDAASRTSVDDVRELIESIRYAAAPGKYRIFVVDEVHMLSTAAFNALLKTLEEPPPRSLFVFATTNPEKIPFTVVSRCQRFDLRRVPTATMVERLREIARAEGVGVSGKSLLAIAREGQGSLRDAMTLLDQVIAAGGEEVDDARVAQVLDLIDRRLVLAIAAACADGDAAGALAACARAGEAGIDARRLGGELLQLLRDLVVLCVAPDAPQLVEGSDAELAELRAVAERADEARLRRMFRALLREQEDLTWAPHPHTVLEMAVVRLAVMPPGDDVAALLQRISALERSLRTGAAPPGEPGGSPGGAGRTRSPGGAGARGRRPKTGAPAPRALEPSGTAASPPASDPGVGPLPEAGAAPEPGSAAAPEDPAPDAPGAPGSASGPSDPPDEGGDAPLDVVFERLRRFARERSHGLSAALEGGSLLERSPGRLRIRLPYTFSARRLEGRRAELERICTELFGRRQQIEIEAAEDASPRRGPPPDSDLARRRRREALNHPTVNLTIQVLEGEVLEIRPLGGRP